MITFVWTSELFTVSLQEVLLKLEEDALSEVDDEPLVDKSRTLLHICFTV